VSCLRAPAGDGGRPKKEKDMNPLRISIPLLSIALSGGIALAQDADKILKDVTQKYQYAKSYHFQGVTRSETTVGKNVTKQETAFDIAYALPQSVKIEFQYPGGDTWTRVSDGSTMIQFRTGEKEPRKTPASVNDLALLKGTFLNEYEHLAERIQAPRLANSETLTIGGQSVECYVIEATVPRTLPENTEALPTRWWIDKNRLLVVKQVTQTRAKAKNNVTENSATIEISRVSFDEPLAANVFAFEMKQAKR
jgi:outer membrane lipoprotein-sorting protein